MSSKKKILKKIMAGIIEVPEGWEQIMKSVTENTTPQAATTTVVVQESIAEITEVAAVMDTAAVDTLPAVTIEGPPTTPNRFTKETTATPTRKSASKTPQTKTPARRTTTKRTKHKTATKAKKE